MKSVPGFCISGEFPINSFSPIQLPDNFLDKGQWEVVTMVVLGNSPSPQDLWFSHLYDGADTVDLRGSSEGRVGSCEL